METVLPYRSKHLQKSIFFYLTSIHPGRDSLLLASLQKSSCRRDTSVGESGDSGQTSWVFDSVVERLGLEAWRRGDWEEIQLGTWWTETAISEAVSSYFPFIPTLELTMFFNDYQIKNKICRCTCSVALVSLPLFLDRHLLGLFSFLGMSYVDACGTTRNTDIKGVVNKMTYSIDLITKKCLMSSSVLHSIHE